MRELPEAERMPVLQTAPGLAAAFAEGTEKGEHMEKFELMRAMFGERPGECWDCHFCHWKIEGRGEARRVGYVWCEVYGIDKENTPSTLWSRSFPACGLYNLSQEPPKRNIYKYAKKDRHEVPALQTRLF